ncbi:MAG: hypothetical protein ABI354_00650 [Candidatus Saccharimonadales bacterium]
MDPIQDNIPSVQNQPRANQAAQATPQPNVQTQSTSGKGLSTLAIISIIISVIGFVFGFAGYISIFTLSTHNTLENFSFFVIMGGLALGIISANLDNKKPALAKNHNLAWQVGLLSLLLLMILDVI